MNRRNFVLSASATLALTSSHVFAQRTTRNANVMTSELTGGEVDISGTTLEFQNQHIDEADGSEHFHFAIGNDGLFDIYFWPQASGDAGQMAEGLADMWVANVPNAEMHASDAYEDGGFVAFGSGSLICYYEYQRNAYPDHDLLILYQCKDNFEENFAATQSILIDGMPPFLYQDESGIFEIASAEMEKTSPGTPEPTSRTTRGSDTEKSQATTNSRSSRSATETSTSSSDNPVDAVIAHQEAFWNSYSEFYDLLEAFTADDATKEDVQDTWGLLVNISLDWQGYPAEAAEIQFSAEHSGLKSAYLDWADGVAFMGLKFEQFALNEATIDDVVAANDALIVLDDDLNLELDSFGSSFMPKSPVVALLQKRNQTKTLSQNHLLAYR